MPEFVTIGETSVVFVAKKMGRMRYSADYEIRPGGAESTVAVGVSRLGHSAGWISRLGNDELGYYLLSFIRGEGVDVQCVDMVEGSPTALFLRERHPGGRARHFYYRACSAFSTMDEAGLDEGYIARSKLLHLTGITPALSESCIRMVHEAITLAQRNGVLVTFDPNMRKRLWSAAAARSILEPIFERVDVVMPGMEDVEAIYGETVSENDIVTHLRTLGCRTIVVKLGSRGALVAAGGRKPSYVETEPVPSPVDLMGAGDAFAAGFITGLLEEKDEREAAELGNAVARVSIQLPGNIESLPTRVELDLAAAGRNAVDR